MAAAGASGGGEIEAPGPGAAGARVTWVGGDFACVAFGEGDAAGQGGRIHALDLREARAEDVVASPPFRDLTDAERGGALILGRVEPVALRLRGESRWLRAALAEAWLVHGRKRLGRDDDDRSLLLLEGRLVGRLDEPTQPYAGFAARAADIGAQVARIHAAPLVASGRSLPVAAGGITWAPATTGAGAPPDIGQVGLGCMVAPLALGVLPLAMLGPLFALGLGGLQTLQVLGLGGGAALVLSAAARWARRRGWQWRGTPGLALLLVAAGCGAAALLPLAETFALGGCSGGGILGGALLGAGILATAACAWPAARVAAVGLALLWLALDAYAAAGCHGGALELAQQQSAEALADDPDAERASKLEGAGGRVALDRALASAWPTTGRCDRVVHLSTGRLFADGAAQLDRGSAPHLRKLARLLRQQPTAMAEIVGHSAPSGQPDRDRDLSRRRADAVAAWLVDAGAIARARVSAHGVGAASSIAGLQRPGDARWRRLQERVEVTLRCPSGAAVPRLPELRPLQPPAIPPWPAPTPAPAPATAEGAP